jgi:molybdenum cofactor cytidylyltransferase
VIAGLILAAGAGSRFGAEPKLLAALDGRPLLEHTVAAQCAVPELARIVVVLGAHAEQISARVDFGRAEVVCCADWQAGQSASLRAGVASVGDAEQVLVTLGDQPLITPGAIARVLSYGALARACYAGRPGHPVLLGPPELRVIAGLSGDQGARSLLASATLVECAELCSDLDVDTPTDLANAASLRLRSAER